MIGGRIIRGGELKGENKDESLKVGVREEGDIIGG